MYLLSVCIPTYNRENNLKNMLNSIQPYRNVEVVICDDGSTDNTKKLVETFNGKLNIKYIFQKNYGVSSAISKAYSYATGKFVIKMDSDDLFMEDGLDYILQSLKKNLNQKAFLFGVKKIQQKIVSLNLPPNGLTNFISVRADLKVKGDLKEVVSRDLVMKYIPKFPNNFRRIPPGLLWVKIAEDFNCLSYKKAVAIKNYLNDGISSKILYLTTQHPESMIELNERLSDSKVYKSYLYRWRSRLLWARYSFHNKSIKIKCWWHWFVLIPGIFFYIIDKIRLFKN